MDELYDEICAPLVRFLSTSDPRHVATIRQFVYASLFYRPLPCLDELPPHFRIFCVHWMQDSFDEFERSCILGAIMTPSPPPIATRFHVLIDDTPVFYHLLMPCFVLYLRVRPDAPFKLQLFRYDTDELIKPSDYCFILTPGEKLRSIKFFD